MVSVVLGAAFSVGLGWLVVRQVSLAPVLEAFRQFNIAWGAAGAAVFFFAIFLRAYRWRLLFVESPVSAFRLFLVQNAGLGINSLSPVRIFSEPTQFFILRVRDRIDSGVILATLGVERLQDLVCASLLLAVGLLVAPLLEDIWAYLIGGTFLALTFAVAVVLLLVRSQRWRLTQRIALLRAFLSSLATMARYRKRMAYSLLVTTVYWILVGVSGWFVAQGMGLELPVMTVTVVILSTIFLSTSLPSVVGAAGTFELVVVSLLGVAGIDADRAFSYAILTHVLLFAPSIVIALFVLPKEGLGSLARLWAAREDFARFHKTSQDTMVPTSDGGGYNGEQR